MRLHIALILVFGLSVAACSNGIENDGLKKIVEKPRHYSGVWLYQFEGSTFLENAAKVPSGQVDTRNAAWLSFSPEAVRPGIGYDTFDQERGCYPIHAFAMEFIGRRVTYPCTPGDLLCGAGHLGGWGWEVKIDRLISAKPLASPPC